MQNEDFDRSAASNCVFVLGIFRYNHDYVMIGRRSGFNDLASPNDLGMAIETHYNEINKKEE